MGNYVYPFGEHRGNQPWLVLTRRWSRLHASGAVATTNAKKKIWLMAKGAFAVAAKKV
jgi:hypothetical protein